MSGLSSVSPSTRLEELRDQQGFPVVLYTGTGRNGTRSLRLTSQDRRAIDITGMTIQLTVKTGPDAADTELDASFPLTGTITNAGNGEFSMDFAAVDFLVPQSRVVIYLSDSSGANPVVLSQSTTVIQKAGV